MGIEIKSLSNALGAEAVGLDLTQDIDDATFHTLRQSWLDNLVLVIRGQKISTDDQLRFARRFGELEEVKSKKDDVNQKQHVLYVSNRIVEGSKGALPEGEMHFHSDQCYYEKPVQLTMLNALELPRRGGETLFVNLYQAWEGLSEDLKARIRHRLIYNQYDYDVDPTRRNAILNENAPHFVHPMVVRHPETGKLTLFVNRLMTHHIVGLDTDQSDRLLSALFDHIEQQAFLYEHKWQPYDLLLWDNRAVLHARRDFDPSEARILRRVAVKGSRPVAAFIAEPNARAK